MLILLKEFSMRGGKRIRPALLYHGYACFAKPHDEVLNASLSIELVQSYFLIHDDIMDKDDLRRNGPTIHKSYENIFQKKRIKDSKHLGLSLAICAGDLACALANQILANTLFSPHEKSRAFAKLNTMIAKVIHGQVLDVSFPYRKNLTEQDLLGMYALKSATYTVEGPLHVGALLAGAKTQNLRQLSAYAIPLGIAFQIQDDILGMFGTEKQIGKPVTSDVEHGKKTLLILNALEKGDTRQKKFIDSVLGRKCSSNQHEQLKKIIVETGALGYCKDYSKNLVMKAKSALLKIRLRNEGKQFLFGIADYLIQREL